MNSMPYTGICQAATAAMEIVNAGQTATATLMRYTNAYTIPAIIAANYFFQVERRRFWSRTPAENALAYLKLGTINMEMVGDSFKGGMQAIEQFLIMEFQSRLHSLGSGRLESFEKFAGRMQRLAAQVAYDYPAAIEAIQSEFGFHFERQPDSSRVDESDRFFLYQVLPTDAKVKTRKDAKPILIVPPYVLGANILSFLPMEKRSYAHAFANQGIPTYIRILKDIETTEAVQIMDREEDLKDTRQFCETLNARHGLPVTLNGYCQGGFITLCNLLSGELDGLVDALITCVAPMDGSCSEGLAKFMQHLPEPFNDLAYGTKTLPNGNKVADGTIMGWVYKLKSIESETPLLAMWRDMMLVSKSNGLPSRISKTAAALNAWLFYDRTDLPLDMTRLSYVSFKEPISKDGTLPVKLLGRTLNLKRMRDKKIPWLICYGKQDDLVEPTTALAPLDHVDAEVTAFPKGHVAMATSWSHPASAYALHLRYKDENTRGPVRFQLDLQQEIDQARNASKKKAGDTGNRSETPQEAPDTTDAK